MKKEKDVLEEIEERIGIDGISIMSLLPFLILCSGWEEKSPEFILNNFNSLSVDMSWQLLTEEEKDRMYQYIVSVGAEKEPRWEDFCRYMVENRDV